MTTIFSLSRLQLFIRKSCSGNRRLSLFSPVTLLGLIAVVFTFFLNTPGEPGYTEKSLKDSEVIKTSMEYEVSKSDPESIYKTIVTDGDAIRSVLQ